MTDARFEKVKHSDKPLYGPRKLLLCGFPAAAQLKFSSVLDMAGIQNIGLVWANADHGRMSLAELLDLPDGSGAGIDSAIPRAIIVAGITENQLHNLMATCRRTGMKTALWAALTPTSETWPLHQLLTELQAERAALSRKGGA